MKCEMINYNCIVLKNFLTITYDVLNLSFGEHHGSYDSRKDKFSTL